MVKYRKKPIVIEAVQWTGKNHREMFDFLTGTVDEPMNFEREDFYIGRGRDGPEKFGGIIIKTLEGYMTAQVGDYIIK